MLCALARADAKEEPPPTTTDKRSRPGGTFTIGAGFDSLEGFVGYAAIGHRRLFGVDGLRLQLDARLSAHRFDARMDLEVAPRRSRLFLGLGAYHSHRELDGLVEGDESGGWLKLGLRLQDGWRLAAGSRVAHVIRRDLFEPEGLEDRRLLSVPFLELSRCATRFDVSGLPLGLDLVARVEHAGRHTGAEFSYTKLDLRLSHGWALPAGFVLQMQGHGGMIGGPEIPLFHRYRLGHPLAGESALPNLGPRLVTPGGVVTVGGTGILHGKMALYLPIIRGHLYGVAGLEAGGLVESSQLSAAAAGVLGLYWRSPIGPLSAGVTMPITAPPDGTKRTPGFIFGIGGRF
jgi:outer membrane protein assembly factor BamA